MRPEVVAFRELDTLVRNLTDQLAGYRRRALSAEARTRELEQETTRVKSALEAAQADAASAVESREHALAAAREASATARQAREALSELERVVGTGTPASTDVFPIAGAELDAGKLAAENERLQARLSEARERTVQLADRVRFLRQQLMQGVDK